MTVRELLAKTSGSELTEWSVYFELLVHQEKQRESKKQIEELKNWQA